MCYTHPSVCPLVCPTPTVNAKMENHTILKLRGEATQVRSNWQSNFEIKMSMG